MGEISISQEFTASADAIWKVIREFGGVGDWAPGIESCEVEGDGPGAVRTIAMKGGMEVKERLESLDDAKRSFSYAITGGPMPFESYLATVTVHESSEGCRVDWGARFALPDGIPEEGIQKGMTAAYSGMLSALKTKLG